MFVRDFTVKHMAVWNDDDQTYIIEQQKEQQHKICKLLRRPF